MWILPLDFNPKLKLTMKPNLLIILLLEVLFTNKVVSGWFPASFCPGIKPFHRMYPCLAKLFVSRKFMAPRNLTPWRTTLHCITVIKFFTPISIFYQQSNTIFTAHAAGSIATRHLPSPHPSYGTRRPWAVKPASRRELDRNGATAIWRQKF